MGKLSLAEHAERANAIVWATADEGSQDRWCEEGLAAEREGHTKTAVAAAFGVARKTYTNRQDSYQMRRSGTASERRRANEASNIRVAKSVVKNSPEAARAIISDPAARKAIEEVLDAHYSEAAKTSDPDVRQVRESFERMGAYGALLSAIEGLSWKAAKTADQVRQADLTAGERRKLAGAAKRAEARVGWLVTFLETGDESFERELAKILEGGRP